MSDLFRPVLAGTTKLLRLWKKGLITALPERIRLQTGLLPPVHDISLNEILEAPRLSANKIANSSSLRITVPPELFLQYDCVLPIGVQSGLKEAMALEAARMLPLSSEEFARAHISEEDKTNNHINVSMAVIRADHFAAVRQFVKKYNLLLHSLTAYRTGDKKSINFKVREAVKTRFGFGGAIVALVGILLFLLTLLPSLYAERLKTATMEVENEIQVLRQSTSPISTLQAKIQSMESLAGYMDARRENDRLIQLLNDLTLKSPDDVSISDLSVEGGKIRLKGLSETPEQWALALEADGLFDDIELTSVFEEDGGARRRFELRLGYEWKNETEELVP